MPTVTAAVPLADFAQFAKAERPTRQKGIQGFLAELSQRSSEEGIKESCLNKLSQLKQRWEKPNTLNSYVTSYSNSVRRWQQSIKLDDSNSFENPTGKGRDVHQGRTHYALRYFTLGKEFHDKRNEAQREKTNRQRRSGQPFDPWQAIAAAEKALTSASYLEQAVGFEFLTGRRPTEVLKRQGFKMTGRYTIEFSAQLKRKEGDVEPYTIYTLTEADKVISTLDRLNREGDVTDLDGEANKDIDSRRNSSMNAAVRRIFKGVLEPPVGEKRLSNKNLRAAYTQAAAVLFKDPKQSMSQFAEELLGHKGVTATVSYEDYVCLDQDGKEIDRGQWRHCLLEAAEKPKSRSKTSMTLDSQRLERFKRVKASDNESHAETLDTLLNAYEEHQAALARIEELERQIKKMSQALEASEQGGDRDGQTDWSQVSSEKLKGSHAPGSAEEKIKRAVAAIIQWNTGKPAKEMYRLSEANVRYLSGSRHGSIKAYFATHPELQDQPSYHFSSQHDRGKTPITEVITW